MSNKEMYSLLRTLSKTEIKKFYRFLNSPYFNTNEKIVSLFGEIIKHYPKFPLYALSNEELYKRIYGLNEFNDSTMRNLHFRLQKLINEFLILENYKRNDLSSKNHLLNELNLRNLKPLFRKYSRDFELQFNNYKEVDNQYFYNKYLFEANKFNFLSLHEFKTKKDKINNLSERLNKSSLYLSMYYITELICNYLNQAIIFRKYNLVNIQNMVSDLVTKIDIQGILKTIYNKDEHDYILELYYQLLKCFSKFDDTENYYKYKNSVNKYVKRLSRDEVSFHYSRLIGYCIYKQKISLYSLEFKKELFNVYDEFLFNECYKSNKSEFLPHELFRNILLLALDIGEFKWTRNFIDKYSRSINPQMRESMYNYGYAFYYYSLEEYEKTLAHIKNINKDFFAYRFDIRHLNIAICFDKGNLEETSNLIHSYRESLNEHRIISKEFRKSHMNYLSYLEKMISYRFRNKKVQIDFLREKISKSDDVFQKVWLFNRCDLMLNKKLKEGDHR
jgi:hypothetical protein